MGVIHHDDAIATEHPAVLAARDATRLPRSRWFLLAAVLVLVAVTLPACGGGDCDAQCMKDFDPPDCKANPEQCT